MTLPELSVIVGGVHDTLAEVLLSLMLYMMSDGQFWMSGISSSEDRKDRIMKLHN